MKGNTAVKAALQSAITAETTLGLQYHLDRRDLCRFGIDIDDGLCKLGEQCREYARELTRRLFFLEGEPTLDPSAATPHDDISSILADAMKAELAIVGQYTEATKVCWDAGDISNFHWFQHLSKWHREGDDKYQGHIAWLQKQQWQLNELGKIPYLATKV